VEDLWSEISDKSVTCFLNYSLWLWKYNTRHQVTDLCCQRGWERTKPTHRCQRTHAHTHTHTYTAHIYTHAKTRTRTRIRKHTHTHTHTYTHTQKNTHTLHIPPPPISSNLWLKCNPKCVIWQNNPRHQFSHLFAKKTYKTRESRRSTNRCHQVSPNLICDETATYRITWQKKPRHKISQFFGQKQDKRRETEVNLLIVATLWLLT